MTRGSRHVDDALESMVHDGATSLEVYLPVEDDSNAPSVLWEDHHAPVSAADRDLTEPKQLEFLLPRFETIDDNCYSGSSVMPFGDWEDDRWDPWSDGYDDNFSDTHNITTSNSCDTSFSTQRALNACAAFSNNNAEITAVIYGWHPNTNQFIQMYADDITNFDAVRHRFIGGAISKFRIGVSGVLGALGERAYVGVAY